MTSANIGAIITGGEHAPCLRARHHGPISYALRIWQTLPCCQERRASFWRAPIWTTIQAITTREISAPCANDATWHMIVRNIAGSAGGPCFGAVRWAISSSACTAERPSAPRIQDIIVYRAVRESLRGNRFRSTKEARQKELRKTRVLRIPLLSHGGH